jgi:DNA polymerase-3 subunit alpha
VKLLGVVSSKKEIATKKGSRIATFELEDLHGYAEVIVFSRLYASVRDILAEGSVISLFGRVESTDESNHRIIADSIIAMPPKTTEPTTPGDYLVSVNLHTVDLEALRHVVDSYAGNLNPEIIVSLDGYTYSLGCPKYLSQLGLEQLAHIDGIQLERRM